ncbi:MAG: hypothetical protein K1X29_06005 [Bdellovibrionales bacterium]|nr:hypothetical protein [Bdellovibrionales bacterium]
MKVIRPRLSLKIVFYIFLFIICNTMGCTHQKLKPSANPFKLWSLQLKGVEGNSSLTRYYSNSRVQDYELDQLVRFHEEIVDFKVSETVTRQLAEKNKFNVLTSTVSKEGTVDLHELAFPELGEEIEYTLDNRGLVFKAGDYPPESIFFVPQLPLPSSKVKVGDTWTFNHEWLSLKNGIPLVIELVTIFKNIYDCDLEHCAELEISGDVRLMGVIQGKSQFNGTVWGRVLMNVESGLVVWSEIRTQEKMIVEDHRTEVLSCLSSVIEKPQNKKWAQIKRQNCVPDETVVPGFDRL